MSYKAEAIKPGQLPRLSKIAIKKQDTIIKETGEPLDPTKTYALLKEATKNFKVNSDIAKELDEQFDELLTKRGFYKDDAGESPAAAPTPKAEDSNPSDVEAKAKRVRIAQAKAKASNARIRILQID